MSSLKLLVKLPSFSFDYRNFKISFLISSVTYYCAFKWIFFRLQAFVYILRVFFPLLIPSFVTSLSDSFALVKDLLRGIECDQLLTGLPWSSRSLSSGPETGKGQWCKMIAWPPDEFNTRDGSQTAIYRSKTSMFFHTNNQYFPILHC